jgi:ketosteroid isomerase-like protein
VISHLLKAIAVAGFLFTYMFSTQSNTPTQEVLAAERALFEAIKNKDTAALSKLLADDFLFRNAGDASVGKSDFLKTVTSVDGTILSVSSDNMSAQTYGEIAIVSGTQKAVVRMRDNSEVTGLGIFTDVFAHRGGKWLLVFAHNIDLPNQ